MITDEDYSKMIASMPSCLNQIRKCGVKAPDNFCDTVMVSNAYENSFHRRSNKNKKLIFVRNDNVYSNCSDKLTDNEYAHKVSVGLKNKISEFNENADKYQEPFLKNDEDDILSHISRREFGRNDKNRKFSIDATIDLHGYTEEAAFNLVKKFIRYSHYRNWRILLIITGHGHYKKIFNAQEETGVIRKNIFRWLEIDEISQFIKNSKVADRYHGGEGAVYVFLKKRKNTLQNEIL